MLGRVPRGRGYAEVKYSDLYNDFLHMYIYIAASDVDAISKKIIINMYVKLQHKVM